MYQPAEQRSSLFSPKTVKYFEALIREGDKFDYSRWLRQVRKEKTQAKQVPAAFSSDESIIPAVGNLSDTPDRRNAWTNSEPAMLIKTPPVPRAVYRSDYIVGGESSGDRLKRRLATVCNAWDDFQECRKRDAVYGYLKAVFALVVDCKGRRRTKRLQRRAFQFAGLPFDKNADPFAAVIRCTSERSIDNKAISKWARALRYAAHCKRPQTPLKTFIKKMGGINACAERYAIYLGRQLL